MIAGAAGAEPPPLALTGVSAVHAERGDIEPDVTVTVREERIASIVPGDSVPEDAVRIDGRGKFLVPGLFDMHVHLSWTRPSALPLLIANGVTGVRDLGGHLAEIDEWRTRISAGLLVGPRIWRVGPILNGEKFNEFQLVVGDPAEARGIVRALKNVGVDFIKTHRRTPRDSYFALIDQAEKEGLPVVGHVPMTVAPAEASDAGQATIEHTETLFEGTFTAGLGDAHFPEAVARFRAEEGEALFSKFVRNHTPVTPTLVAFRSILEVDERSRYVARSLRTPPPPASPAELDEHRRTLAEFIEVVRQMHECGVTLLAGSDIAGPRVPGFTLHDELELLVEAGLTPADALRAATLEPGRVLGSDQELGTIEPGKVADLVLLRANPLEDIRNTQAIDAVAVGGRLFDRADLDELLALGERIASVS